MPEHIRMREMISRSAEETFKIGYECGKGARAGQVYTLSGDLGTGKTVFTKGFAAGLGIRDEVNSPTFTILQTYEDGRLPLHHFDVYRIGDPEEMYEIGWEEYAFGEGVCLIEWADLIGDLIAEVPRDRLTEVKIEKDPEKGYDFRRIVISKEKTGD